MEEDRGQPFATFVLETLARRSAELGQRWAEHTQLLVPHGGDRVDDVASTHRAAERLVRALLEAADADAASGDGVHRRDPVMRAGSAIGAAAYRRNASLHQLLRDLDLLTTALLEAAERETDRAIEPAPGTRGGGTGRDGLAVARAIIDATSVLRLAATSGYTQALEDGLRERYRAIRHDLRNPLGTIKSALALLTDDSLPPEMRHGSQVRAMVVRNARSLDQLIGEALGDDAARLRAFEAPPSAVESGREQPDDVGRSRQRPDLESGTL